MDVGVEIWCRCCMDDCGRRRNWLTEWSYTVLTGILRSVNRESCFHGSRSDLVIMITRIPSKIIHQQFCKQLCRLHTRSCSSSPCRLLLWPSSTLEQDVLLKVTHPRPDCHCSGRGRLFNPGREIPAKIGYFSVASAA